MEGVALELGGGVQVAGSIGKGIGVETEGGVWVAGFIGAAHEINTLANSVMTPKFTCRFIRYFPFLEATGYSNKRKVN